MAKKTVKVRLSPSKKNIFCFFCLMKALKNYEKCFIRHLKSSFRSQDT